MTSFQLTDRIVQLLTTLKTRPIVIRWVYLFAFLALVSPTVINYSPYPLFWDESYYLHRIICGNQAVYSFRLSRLNECLAHTHKGPIMEVVNLPFGLAGGTERGIGLAFVGLSLFIWILILITCRTCLVSGISPESLVLAAVTICCTPFLRASAGAMMTDILLGWCVALALMLIPLEYSKPSMGFWPSVGRGLLWSLVVNVGMLNKVTFFYFLCAITAVLLILRSDYSGEWPLRYALAASIVGSLPAILIWRYYGLQFLNFAVMSAWGGRAPLWSVPGMTAVGYLERYVSQLGLALIPLSIQLVVFVRGMVIDNQSRLIRLLPIAIILIYLGIAARSQNRDPRFSIPVMIAMPLCLVWHKVSKKPSIRLGVAPVLAALLVGTAFFLPMIRRPELPPIRRAGDLLEALYKQRAVPGRPIKVTIATDGPTINIETFLLAKQIRWDSSKNVVLDTLVYDAINKVRVEDGFRSIDAANFVLFLKPEVAPGPDWSRVYAADYRTYCEKVGILQNSNISTDFDVFEIGKQSANGSPLQTSR